MKKEDIDKMTLQEACDYAVNKLVEQGCQCINKGETCVYSDQAGNHCAIGWLLDENDNTLMLFEGCVNSLNYNYDNKLPNIITDNLTLFTILQDFHDINESAIRQLNLDRMYKEFNIDTKTNVNYQTWVNMAPSGEEV